MEDQAQGAAPMHWSESAFRQGSRSGEEPGTKEPLLLVTAGSLETGGQALLREYIVKFGAISNE